jgi:hypothetical protein
MILRPNDPRFVSYQNSHNSLGERLEVSRGVVIEVAEYGCEFNFKVISKTCVD